MSKQKSFFIWCIEKLIEHGHSSGGMGWMIYWIFGLFGVVLFDVIVLRVQISIWSGGYVIITAVYLIWRAFNKAYAQWWEETK